jgi:hypothetical protein
MPCVVPATFDGAVELTRYVDGLSSASAAEVRIEYPPTTPAMIFLEGQITKADLLKMESLSAIGSLLVRPEARLPHLRG